MSALVVGETGDALGRERLGDVPVAVGMLGNSVHDDESGLELWRHDLEPREGCPDHGLTCGKSVA